MKVSKMRLFTIFLLIFAIYNLSAIFTFENDIGFYSQSYVASINTPIFGNQIVEQTLQEFNSLVETDIVKKSGFRPIIFIENNWLLEKVDALGISYPTPFFCLITLKPNTSEDDKKALILHEYLHCFNFKHIENKPTDLMFPYLMGTSFQSVIKYSKLLEQKIKK